MEDEPPHEHQEPVVTNTQRTVSTPEINNPTRRSKIKWPGQDPGRIIARRGGIQAQTDQGYPIPGLKG